jgi:membrane-bound lytic murein transglycosylase B
MLPLPEWQALGVRKINGTDLPPRNITGALVFPDGANGSAFITYNNYSAIMAYNCAHHYAITVGLLSDKIQGIN